MIWFCKNCHRLRKVRKYSFKIKPGVAEAKYMCSDCADRYCDWDAQVGIAHTSKTPLGNFIKYVGTPYVTDECYGQNAFGSVLAQYENGSTIGVICGHGGSEWLCLKCAKDLVEAQNRCITDGKNEKHRKIKNFT